MKAELHMSNPPVAWQAMARMIEYRPEFRPDVTMVVEPDRVKFLDGQRQEIPLQLPPREWVHGQISDLDTTLSLLDWLEESFAQIAS